MFLSKATYKWGTSQVLSKAKTFIHLLWVWESERKSERAQRGGGRSDWYWDKSQAIFSLSFTSHWGHDLMSEDSLFPASTLFDWLCLAVQWRSSRISCCLYNNHYIVAPVSLNFSPPHPLNLQVFARKAAQSETDDCLSMCVWRRPQQEGSEYQDLHAIRSRVNAELLNFLEFVTWAAVHER